MRQLYGAVCTIKQKIQKNISFSGLGQTSFLVVHFLFIFHCDHFHSCLLISINLHSVLSGTSAYHSLFSYSFTQGSFSVMDEVEPTKNRFSFSLWKEYTHLGTSYFPKNGALWNTPSHSRQPSMHQQNKQPSSQLSVLAGILYRHLKNKCQISHENIIKCSAFIISLEVFLIDRNTSNYSHF